MDCVLLAISVLFFSRGCFKGAISMIFSLLGTFLSVVFAWWLCSICQPLIENWIGQSLTNNLTTIINGAIEGSFSDLPSLQTAIAQSKYAFLFNFFLTKVIGNLSIDGQMTAGQILAPSICNLLIKIITFALLFVCIYVLLKILTKFLNKILKKCGLSFGNRILGGGIGLVKGLVIFGVVFFVLSSIANLSLSEPLLQFVRSGTISNWLYDSVILKVFNLIY